MVYFVHFTVIIRKKFISPTQSVISSEVLAPLKCVSSNSSAFPLSTICCKLQPRHSFTVIYYLITPSLIRSYFPSLVVTRLPFNMEWDVLSSLLVIFPVHKSTNLILSMISWLHLFYPVSNFPVPFRNKNKRFSLFVTF